MTRHAGGSEVRGGYYLSLDRWQITTICGDRGMLEGAGEERYVELILPAVVAVAVVISLAYALFLPFIGFAMVLRALGARLFVLGRGLVGAITGAGLPASGPAPAELAGGPDPKKEKVPGSRRS